MRLQVSKVNNSARIAMKIITHLSIRPIRPGAVRVQPAVPGGEGVPGGRRARRGGHRLRTPHHVPRRGRRRHRRPGLKIPSKFGT